MLECNVEKAETTLYSGELALFKQVDKEAFDRVISYSQDIPNPQTDELLKTWARQKFAISQRFLDRKVSYTYPELVRFELNKQAKEERLDHLVDFIVNVLDNYRHPLVYFLNSLGTEAFYNNTVEEDYIIDPNENKKIQKGSKVVKAFKYFLDDEILLHDLQNKASCLIQENKIEGYLTFSIHPLDFLSSSENNYNWRSCHALDGEYRAGNLSYMCDTGTMMVYLSPKEHTVLPHFPADVPWNNKKWRMLLHFDNNLDVCFAGRQYPFNSPGALDKIYEIFMENLAPKYTDFFSDMVKTEKWIGWYNDYINTFTRSGGENIDIYDGKYFIVNNGLFNKYEVVQDAKDSKHFNDITRSSYYEKPYYMFKEYYCAPEKINFTVGAPVKCLRCGEELILGDDTMMCIDCECKYGNSDSDEYRYCSCCGTRFYFEDGYWVGNDDDFVCPACAETETFVCADCGGTYYNSEKYWSEDLRDYVCGSCHLRRKEG